MPKWSKETVSLTKRELAVLLDAVYQHYPEGASSMPDRLEEAVIDVLWKMETNTSTGVLGWKGRQATHEQKQEENKQD